MELPNRTFVDLPLAACHLIDIPSPEGYECSPVDINRCVRCPILGRFITHEGMDEYFGTGHVVSLVLCYLTGLVGTLGALGNILIICILKRQNSGRAFDTFLIGLACFDLICSWASVMSAFSTVAHFQNWTRGYANLIFWYVGTLFALFARSGSSFMTVLIGIERYLVVTFPIRMANSFTVNRTRILTLIILFLSILTALPRFTSIYIGENTFARNISSLHDLDYVFLSSRLEKIWYFYLDGFFDKIDFFLPLPLLIIFNVLLYYQIKSFTARRKELNLKHKKDIRAASMFLRVVVILFLCNIIPIVHYYYISVGIVYRETHMAELLSFTINSAVNLPIYYLRGSSFRRETKVLLVSSFPFLKKFLVNTEEGDKVKRNGKAEGGCGCVGVSSESPSARSNSNTENNDNECNVKRETIAIIV